MINSKNSNMDTNQYSLWEEANDNLYHPSTPFLLKMSSNKELQEIYSFLWDLSIAVNKDLIHKIEKVKASLTPQGFFLNHSDIEAYLNGTLSSPKKEILEKRLQLDEDFKADFNYQVDLKASLSISSDQALRDKIATIGRSYAISNRSKKNKSKPIVRQLLVKRLLIAASFLLPLMIAVAYLLPSEEDIILSYSQQWSKEEVNTFQLFTDKESIEGLGLKEGVSDEWDLAFIHFNEGEFEKAEPYFSIYAQNNPDTKITDFFLAICWIQQSPKNDIQLQKAIQKLLALPVPIPPIQNEAISFQLACAYLLLDQKENAIEQLEIILKSTNKDYTQKADKLLQRIN